MTRFIVQRTHMTSSEQHNSGQLKLLSSRRESEQHSSRIPPPGQALLSGLLWGWCRHQHQWECSISSWHPLQVKRRSYDHFFLIHFINPLHNSEHTLGSRWKQKLKLFSPSSWWTYLVQRWPGVQCYLLQWRVACGKCREAGSSLQCSCSVSVQSCLFTLPCRVHL